MADEQPQVFQIAVSAEGEFVRVAIGDSAWFLMPKPQALQFAFAVLQHCGVEVTQHDLTKGKPS